LYCVFSLVKISHSSKKKIKNKKSNHACDGLQLKISVIIEIRVIRTQETRSQELQTLKRHELQALKRHELQALKKHELQIDKLDLLLLTYN
jgi:hypothetical protein